MATSQDNAGKAIGEPDALARHSAAFAIGGGLAAAFGSSFIPMTAIEGFVTAYGIAELLPAAAPPLGNTARLALSAGIGTLTAGALLALLPRTEAEEMGFETTVTEAQSISPDATTHDTATGKSGKLAGWLRTLRFGKSEPDEGTVTDFADINRLRIRNGHHHPDAPIRAPILASSDLADADVDATPLVARPNAAQPLELGEDMAFAAAAAENDAPDVASPALTTDMMASPEPHDDYPVAEDIKDTTPEPHAEPVQDARVIQSDLEHTASFAAQPAQPVVNDELEALSVAELLERLEAGIGRRRQPSSNPIIGGSRVPEATARMVSLTQPSSLSGDASVNDSGGEAEARPLRFRLGQPKGMTGADSVEDNAGASPFGVAEPKSDAWIDGGAYEPPAISAADTLAGPAAMDTADAAEPEAPNTSASQAPASDDDMDAALRDALATLRQLSDRQRNS